MLLSEYQTELAKIIDRYSRTDLLIASELSVDARTPKIGMVKGTFTFADGTRLFFSEYLDARYRMEKLSYAYHCQDAEGSLLFRYDNATHKPMLPFVFHKHLHSGEIIESEPPNLDTVIDEIMERFIP